VRAGTIVDATIIHAPSSTKNITVTRDPRDAEGKKGKARVLRVTVQVGTDPRGLVHILTTPDAGWRPDARTLGADTAPLNTEPADQWITTDTATD
jgi:IS5 family transposase